MIFHNQNEKETIEIWNELLDLAAGDLETTSGTNRRAYAHACAFEVLQRIQNERSNTVAEALQNETFEHTYEWNTAFENYRKKVMKETEITNEQKANTETDATEVFEMFEKLQENPEVPEESLINLNTFIIQQAYESNFSILDSSIAKTAFVSLVEQMSDSDATDFLYRVKTQIGGICRKLETAEEKPLDLSEMTAPADGDCIDLAEHLEAVIYDERTPIKVKKAVTRQLAKLGHKPDAKITKESINDALCGGND